MPRTSRSLAVFAQIPVFAVAVGAAIAGCDQADSDQAARQKLDEAYAFRSASDKDNRHVGLADQVAGTQSGDATLAQAHELVGDVSVDQAAAVIGGVGREPEPGLGGLQTRAIVLAEQANRLASSLAMSRAYVETEQKKDPKLVLEAVEQRLSSIRAGEGWNPSTEVEGQLPTLDTTTKRIDELNARLAELNGQITELEERRSQMLAQASEFDQQSDQQRGQQSVDTYAKAAALRTEAAEVSAGVGRLQAQVRQSTAEVEEAMALRDALQQAITTLEEQQQGLRQKWDGVQTQIGQIQESAQQTFAAEEFDEAKGNPQSSVELIARELAPTLASLAEQRGQAVTFLEKAASSYESASAKATAAASPREEMFRSAFGAAFNSSRLSLSRANALRQLGSVHAGTAAAYAAVFQLQQTLKDSGRDLPESVQQAIPQPVGDAYIEAVDAAAKAFAEADEILGRLSSGGSARGPGAAAALTQRAAVISALWGLHSLIETTGVPVTAELPAREGLQQTARDLAAVAQTGGVPLPAAPPFVGADALAPTTEPTTQPTTEPATQGAEGEPTTQPAEEGAAQEGAGAEGGDEGDAGGQPSGV